MNLVRKCIDEDVEFNRLVTFFKLNFYIQTNLHLLSFCWISVPPSQPAHLSTSPAFYKISSTAFHCTSFRCPKNCNSRMLRQHYCCSTDLSHYDCRRKLCPSRWSTSSQLVSAIAKLVAGLRSRSTRSAVCWLWNIPFGFHSQTFSSNSIRSQLDWHSVAERIHNLETLGGSNNGGDDNSGCNCCRCLAGSADNFPSPNNSMASAIKMLRKPNCWSSLWTT